MSDTSGTPIAVSRTIHAPAEVVFSVLADPTTHPVIDGSGMLRRALSPSVIRGVGDTFAMEMHNDELGAYEMTNHVVEFEPNHRIGWEPVLSKASRPEDQADIGDRGHQVWAFEVAPIAADRTEVTETYDCTRSPDWLRKAVRDGERWRESMTATLDKLEQLATTSRAGGRAS